MQKYLRSWAQSFQRFKNTSHLWNNGQKIHVLTWLEAFIVEPAVLSAGIQCWYVKGQILPQRESTLYIRERGRTIKTILMRFPLLVVLNCSPCCYGIWEQAPVAWGFSSLGSEFPVWLNRSQRKHLNDDLWVHSPANTEIPTHKQWRKH